MNMDYIILQDKERESSKKQIKPMAELHHTLEVTKKKPRYTPLSTSVVYIPEENACAGELMHLQKQSDDY